MPTFTFKVSELNNEYMEKIIKEKLKHSDGVLDVSVNCKTQEVSVAMADGHSTCEGVFCLLNDLGYKVRRP